MPTDTIAFPIDHLALQGKDDCNALIVKNNVLTYKMLNLRISCLSFWLLEQGLHHGDRVATWTNKSIMAAIMPLAAARAGLVHVPINPILKPTQVGYIMEDSGAKLLIANKARLSSLDASDDENGKRVNSSFYIYDENNVYASIENSENHLPPSKHDVDDLAAILYTSGSTGRPKGVMLSHRNLWLGAYSVSQYLRLKDDDRTLAVLPLSFDYGQNQLLSAWYSGGTAVCLDYLSPKDVVKACAKHNITTLAAVPPLWVQLSEYDWSDFASSVRRITNSGGALTEALYKSLRSIFDTADIYAMYGLTEAFRSTYLDPKLIEDNPLSMGTAIPFAEIMVVNDKDERAAPNEHGELVHAGPLVARGYWNDKQRTAERFKPAPSFSEYGGIAVWSGDTVYRDENDLLYFVGRDDAMIKTSGNRVSPGEIDEVVVATDWVLEACAVGQKDDRLGEVIILFVRANPSNDEIGDDQLRAHLKSILPSFMQPKEIFWLEQFPKNANGKIDRNTLLKRLETMQTDILG